MTRCTAAVGFMAGADTFSFAPGHEADVIRDFADGEDRIDVSRLGITRLEDVGVSVVNGTVLLDFSAHGGGTVRLFPNSFRLDDLDASDFIFASGGTDGGGTGGGTGGGGTGGGTGGLTGITRHGGAGDDVINGSAERTDLLYGGAGNDTLNGHAGSDLLFGESGNDRLVGGTGDDFLFGGNRGDHDTLIGGEGNDALEGSHRLYGGVGDDTLWGSGRLYGGAGDDHFIDSTGRLFGDAGNDTLRSGTSDDWLEGGVGSDVFVFDGADGNDTIADFTDGVDRIDLREYSLSDLKRGERTPSWRPRTHRPRRTRRRSHRAAQL